MNHLSFTDSSPEKRAKALSLAQSLLRFASREHAALVIGLLRGAPVDGSDAIAKFSKNLVECDRAAKELGGRIALEAINRYETTLLNDASDAATLIRRERLVATGLLLDTFHMNIEETSIVGTIQKYASNLGHFHIADSNRWPPGYGHLNLEEILRVLDSTGYAGWVSTETLPRPDNVRAVVDTGRFLRERGFI